MNRLKHKLSSQTGASITYALLLFLVCAVVSSIVLAAGTAASGRISGSVQHDQRYYSVTSAADMLIELFDGVTVETQTTQTGTSTDVTLVDGYPVISKDGTAISDTDAGNYYGLLTLATAIYTGTASEAQETSFPAGEKMAITVGSDQNAILEFSFEQDQDQSDSGRFIFKISSYDEDDDEDRYSLYLTFDANIKEIEDSKTEDDYSSGTASSTVTVTTTTEMTWTLTSMSPTAPAGWETTT